MRKSTKILIGILIILIIALVAYITYIWAEDTLETANEVQNEIQNETDMENTTNTTKDIEENKINTENTTSTVVGKEEKESSQQSGTENPEKKAIELAKKEWGETSDSYNFVVEAVEGNVYHVAVISNTITISYMEVNIETGEVIEK